MTDNNRQSWNPGDADSVHEAVRERYAGLALAAGDQGGGGCTGPSCCAPASSTDSAGTTAGPAAGRRTGSSGDPITADLYDAHDQAAFPGAVNASLGCGNPTALTTLHPGQVVLDLGSGGGLDVLRSAQRVAPGGRAYGLDMTPQMLDLARAHQREAGIDNAEFLLGTIDDIPLPEASVDVVISNCVINLAPDKDAVLAQAHRVLRPGGTFAVSDIVLLRPLPPALREVVALWTGCISGALLDTEYVAALERAGFADAGVEITRRYSREDVLALGEQVAPADRASTGVADLSDLAAELEGSFAAAFVRAVKPG